jgi:hypothetical protein
MYTQVFYFFFFMGVNDNVSGLIFSDKALFALPGMACREI